MTATAPTTAYRDPLEPLLVRRRELVERRRAETRAADVARELHARRCARAAFGIVASAAFVLMALHALVAATDRATTAALERALGVATPLSAFLVGGWIAGAIAYVATRACVGLANDRRAASTLAMGDDVQADVRRLEATAPLDAWTERAARLEALSIGAPMVAVSLLLPLSVHGLVAAIGHLGDFDVWIDASLLIVGHAHLALAICAIVFARNLRGRVLSGPQRNAGWTALAITIGVACVPGIVLYAIPPLLVAVTGVLFIPLLFSFARRIAANERVRLVEPGPSEEALALTPA